MEDLDNLDYNLFQGLLQSGKNRIFNFATN
jgi:hypothetical protein